MVLGCYAVRFLKSDRNTLTANTVTPFLVALATFAWLTPPACASSRPQFESRLEGPRTNAPVQADSVFAAVVAATPAISVIPVSAPDTTTLPIDVAQLSLDGDWKFRLESAACEINAECEGIRQSWFATTFDDSTWRELEVPGHFTRQIPVEELGGRDSALPFNFAWYRREFTVPASIDATQQRLRLLFEAVDYRADVWLDGVKLNTVAHLGTFNPFVFDLPALAPGSAHTIAVRVQKPLDPGILACGDGTGAATDLKTTIDGTKGYWDGRPGGNDDNFDAITKQSLHTGGIVRPVSLTATGPVRLDWTFVTALPRARHRADIVLTHTLTNNTGADADVTIATDFTGSGLTDAAHVAVQARLHPGPNRVEVRTRLNRIQRWFPAGQPELGGPTMYAATTRVLHDPGSGARVTDARSDRFGIRSIGFTSDRCEDRFAGESGNSACRDEFTYTGPRARQGVPPDRPIQRFFFNGRPIFLRGAAADPDAWIANIDRAFSDRYMQLTQSINANHLGMAVQIAPPVFYDAADDAGIALVQDFELQWSYNDIGFIFECSAQGSALPTAPRNDARAAQVFDDATKIAADEIYLLYNHPSIIQWVMHNEPTWELVEVLGDYQPIIRVLANVGRTMDRQLVDLASDIDRTRPVKAGAGVGDSHIYSGYLLCSFYDLLGLDPARTVCNAESTRTAPFPSEFGAQNWPFSAKRWMDPASLFPSDPTVRRQTWTETNPKNRNEVVPWLREWTYHAHQPETMAVYVGSPADYDRFQDYAFASQLYQQSFLKFYIEHYRKDLFRPTSGLRFFFFRGFWEQAYFDIFDQYDLPATAVPVVRDAYAQILVTSQVDKPVYRPGEPIRLPLWVVNNRFRRLDRSKIVWKISEVSDAYVIRGVVDFETAPFQDERRAFLGLAEALPPQPVITTVPRIGAPAIGGPLRTGSAYVDVSSNSVSPREGESVIELVAPPTDGVRQFLLQLELRQGRETIARNEHLITVASPEWLPPPGLSDGFTSYGENENDRPLRFTLTVHGLEVGQEVSLDVPGYQGSIIHIEDGVADTDGTLTFNELSPDEYVVSSAGVQIAHLTLTRDTIVDTGSEM